MSKRRASKRFAKRTAWRTTCMLMFDHPHVCVNVSTSGWPCIYPCVSTACWPQAASTCQLLVDHVFILACQLLVDHNRPRRSASVSIVIDHTLLTVCSTPSIEKTCCVFASWFIEVVSLSRFEQNPLALRPRGNSPFTDRCHVLTYYMLYAT